MRQTGLCQAFHHPDMSPDEEFCYSGSMRIQPAIIFGDPCSQKNHNGCISAESVGSVEEDRHRAATNTQTLNQNPKP